MKINDSHLKELYLSYLREKIPKSRKDCPLLKDIILFFNKKVPGKKKTKIIDHLTECSRCSQEFLFLVDIYRAEQRLEKEICQIMLSEKNPLKEKKQGFSPWKKFSSQAFPGGSWKLMISVCAATVLACAFLILENRIHRDISSNAQTERGKRDSRLALIEPVNGTYPKSSLIFKWKELKESEYYIFEIFDESLLPLWKSPKIYTNYFTLPEEIAEKLANDKSYFWMVTAYSNEKKQIDSDLESFSLSR